MSRVSDIHALKLHPSLAARQYASKAVSVFGYIAQVVPPPKILKNSSLNAVVSIMNLPGRVFDFTLLTTLIGLEDLKFLMRQHI